MRERKERSLNRLFMIDQPLLVRETGGKGSKIEREYRERGKAGSEREEGQLVRETRGRFLSVCNE